MPEIYNPKYEVMKTNDRISIPSKILSLVILFILTCTSGYTQIDLEKRSKLIKPEVEITGEIFWHVKAFRPEAQLLNVKAIDNDGTFYDVKAIQTSESTSILNIKALVNGKQLPIKILLKENAEFYPVKAIREDGSLIDIKALNDDGAILDVKGVSQSGNVIDLMAITADSKTYNIISISPFGEVNAVKGIKMTDSPVEAVINGVSIFAHVKAIKQN